MNRNLPASFALMIITLALAPAIWGQAKPTVVAKPDLLFTLYFARCGPGWTGGDSTFSTQLSGDRVAWIFSDSVIGRVDEKGMRDGTPVKDPTKVSAKFIQGNVLVTQNLTSAFFTSYLTENGKTVARASFPRAPFYDKNCPRATEVLEDSSQAFFLPRFAPPGPAGDGLRSCKECAFWAGDMFVEGKVLQVFLRMLHTSDSLQNIVWKENWIGSIPVSSLVEGSRTGTPIANTPTLSKAPGCDTCPNKIQYGAAVLPDVQVDGKWYTYIYGTRTDSRTSLSMHLARVPRGGVTDGSKWEFYGLSNNKRAFTSLTANSVPLVTDSSKTVVVSPEFSVTKITGCGKIGSTCYVLISHEFRGWPESSREPSYSSNIQARYATSPEGPWSEPIQVYTTPETGQLYTYNSHMHPELTNTNLGGYLVSYNVNTKIGVPQGDPNGSFRNANNSTPRFIRVSFVWPSR